MAIDYRTEDAGPILKGMFLWVPYDYGFIGWLKETVPWSERAWRPEDKCWYISDTYASTVQRELHKRWPMHASAWDRYSFEKSTRDSNQRAQDQSRQRAGWAGGQGYGGTTSGSGGQRFYHGFAQSPPPSSHHAKLYVTPDAPPEVIKAAYKALAMKYHPDRGGDGRAMVEVNAAFEALQKAGKC